jgi:hypothetical protein
MPKCRSCAASFPNWLAIDGVRRNLSSRKYCFDCSPRGGHNTHKLELPPRPALERKNCPHCGEEKDIEDFYLRPNGTRSHSWCKVCNNEHRKARFRQDRYDALLHYSGGHIRCVCCGEERVQFLGLDHINNDGGAHRRALGVDGGRSFYSWLRLTGYTYAALAVACHNCNMARAMYGQCPHKAAPQLGRNEQSPPKR